MAKERTYENVLQRKREHLDYESNLGDYVHYVSLDYGEVKGIKLKENYVVDYKNIQDLHVSTATPSINIHLNRAMKVEIDNYIIDFWGYFLSPLEIQVYMTLLRWSFQKGFTNISTRELAERMRKTPKTIQSAIDTLESHFFLIKIYRKSVKSEKSITSNSNLFIRLRDTTPLLNELQIEELPKFMQIEHEQLLRQLNSALTEEEYIRVPSKKAYLRSFIHEKATCEDKVDKNLSFIVKEHGMYQIACELFHIDYETDYQIKTLLEKNVSKATYDVVITNSVFIIEENTLFIICKDEYCESVYKGNTFDILLTNMIKDGLIKVDDFMPVRFSSYYKAHYDHKNHMA